MVFFCFVFTLIFYFVLCCGGLIPIPTVSIIEGIKRDIKIPNIKSPCAVCYKHVNYDNLFLTCTLCENKIHLKKCTDIWKAEYNYRTQLNNVIPNLAYDESWVCPKCIINYQVEHFPYGRLNDEDIVNLKTSSSMCLHDMIPVFDPNSTSSVINDLAHNDINVNLPLRINCKYYSNDEFSRLPVKEGSLNLFHTNVNGLEGHFDNQETTNTDSNLRFNAICITETSHRENDEFKRNINRGNFYPIFSRGGTSIYVKSTHHTIERNDLKICNKEYDSTWIEILNQKCENVVIGCIYRRPHYDNLDDFGSYMKNLFLKLNKENNEVYICGDFNINLFKYDDELVVQDLYNLMNSNGYLPQINLPIRITDTTMTLIDNIFTNTMNYNSFSGYILIEIADHLSQFLSVDTSKIEYKKLDIYKRDYSNFNE